MVRFSYTIRLKIIFVTFQTVLALSYATPTTPIVQRTRAWHTIGLGFFPFARRYWGNRSFLSFPGVTEMFHFSPFSLIPYIFRYQCHSINLWQVSPFGNLRITACLTTPRSLSQSSTSFFASQRQDIHHVPFTAWQFRQSYITHNWGSNCYPLSIHFSKNKHNHLTLNLFLRLKVVEMSGVEPPTSALQGQRSPNWATSPYIQSSANKIVGLSGLEPLTFPLSGECSKPTEL